MICKPIGVSVALAALIFGAAQADADLIVVEGGPPGDLLRISDTGSSKTVFATANLNAPLGISADSSGNIYAVNADSVSKYSPTGTPLGFYVPPANGGTLSGPIDIAFTPANNGFVTNDNSFFVPGNPGPGFISQFNSAGTFVPPAFGGGTTNVPTGIGYDPANQRLFVSNAGNNTVTVYNPANVSAPAVVNSGLGLNQPQQIAFDAAGNVYVANFGSDNVQEFSTNAAGNLTLLRTFTPTGQSAGTGAEGVAVDPLGNVYISLFNGNTPLAGTIDKFNAAGTELGIIATGLNNVGYIQYQVAPQAVPEPGSLALAGVGLVGAAGYRLARRKRRAEAA